VRFQHESTTSTASCWWSAHDDQRKEALKIPRSRSRAGNDPDGLANLFRADVGARRRWPPRRQSVLVSGCPGWRISAPDTAVSPLRAVEAGHDALCVTV
jgi:hypothetical protein